MPVDHDPQSTPADDIGARLRAAREARQISLRQISAKTKISINMLESIEENDVARLPGGVFTRAFVRTYAHEVGLDPEQTERDYIAHLSDCGVADVPLAVLQLRDARIFLSRQRMTGAVLTLALASLTVAALLLYLDYRTAVAPEIESEVSTPLAPVRAELPPLPVPAEASIAERQLDIVVRPAGDCFVSLTIDGELAFSRLMHEGERESYTADEEIIIDIGDAATFGFELNERQGRSLGESGEAVTARITHENYHSYIAP